MSFTTPDQNILELIDLTLLNDNDTNSSLMELCSSATTPFGTVAAICIHSQFISLANEYFKAHQQAIPIATVVNFPAGNLPIAQVMQQIEQAINLGASEIDLVLPYLNLSTGDTAYCELMLNKARQVCHNHTLKIILETGMLASPQLIELASKVAINAGADFIKTSTGKVTVNATLAAAEVMLTTIKAKNSNCGFKAAGGIRLLSEAEQYLNLAATIMGSHWINKQHFRFGASSLLTAVLSALTNQPARATSASNSY